MLKWRVMQLARNKKTEEKQNKSVLYIFFSHFPNNIEALFPDLMATVCQYKAYYTGSGDPTVFERL